MDTNQKLWVLVAATFGLIVGYVLGGVIIERSFDPAMLRLLQLVNDYKEIVGGMVGGLFTLIAAIVAWFAVQRQINNDATLTRRRERAAADIAKDIVDEISGIVASIGRRVREKPTETLEAGLLQIGEFILRGTGIAEHLNANAKRIEDLRVQMSLEDREAYTEITEATKGFVTWMESGRQAIAVPGASENQRAEAVCHLFTWVRFVEIGARRVSDNTQAIFKGIVPLFREKRMAAQFFEEELTTFERAR